MTGNNTTPGEKLRAIFLAVLMVGSAFAMGIAFTGGAAADVTSVDPIADQETVGDSFTVNITVDAGDQVTVENYVDGEVKDSFTATDGGTNDLDGANNSNIEVELTAGKTYNGSSRVVVTGPNGNTETATYDTSNYDVQLEDDTVLQGETSTIEGTIYEYPGDLVDDHTVDYRLAYDSNISDQDANSTVSVVASSDTGSGLFQVVRTFDEVATDFQNDYPTDDAEVGVDAQPSYVAYVAESYAGTNTTTDTDYLHNGSAQIDTRLEVSGDVVDQDGTATDPSYGQTVDVVNGSVANADGGLGSYALRVEDPTGSTQKTTTSASDGSFGFTLELSDAGTWNLGTNEGAFIGYQDIVVDAQQADLQFSAEGDNLATFEETYNIQLNDSEDGFPLVTEENLDAAGTANESHVRGYINVTGPFDDSLNTGQAGIIDNATPSGDEIAWIHVATDSTGAASFNATPAEGADVTATLELENGSETYEGLEQMDDAAASPSEPDYTASESLDLGGADPVNIIDERVEDPRTANPSYTNETSFGGNYTDILTDAGPAVVEVLPLADTVGDRINNEERFGNDSFQNVGNMTVYRPSFELRNETNQAIEPLEGTDGHFDHMEINGAEINATVYANDTGALKVDAQNGNVLDANYTDVDGDGRAEYAFLIRPTATDEADEQITHEIHVQGEDPVTLPLDAAGLEIEEFLIDGEETNEILGDQNVDLTSVVNAPYDNFAPVNNGLVRLTQSGHALDTETDARTSNVNDGEYTFENITLGPRGIDSGSDGIADNVSQLTFTAYQYSDLNPQNNALEQQEVDRAAVRTVDLAADDTLQVEYLPEQTSTYSGFQDTGDGEQFTLTKGVEYEQIAFELTTADGEPVNLTEGIGNTSVSLNTLANASLDGEPFVEIVGPDGNSHGVYFNESASDPANGTYVIDDIQNSTYVDSTTNGTPSADDAFGFDNSTNDVDTFQLGITTPDASYMTDEDTGHFDAANPNIDTEIIGVNESDVNHNLADNFTSVEGVETMTIGIDRWYRVEGQVTDALGTPINGTVLDDTNLTLIDSGVGDATVEFLSTGNNSAAGSTVTLNNETGLVMFDIKPNESDADGEYLSRYSLEAYTDASAFTSGSNGPVGEWDDTPEGQLPRVQVYDQSGAMLPVDDETGNMILANDVTQTLRVEAFPADDGDLPVPSLSYAIDTASDPVAETTINTDTSLINDTDTLVSDNPAPYPNVPYEVGQVGYLTVTPTGTGDGIIDLRSGNATGPVTKTIDNEDITFDVLRSNKQVNLELGSEAVTPGGTLDVTVTRESNGEPLNLASIALSDTNGNVIGSFTTNADGVATIEIDSEAELGTYTLETRPAGFEPMTQSFQVESDAQLDEELELYADDEQVISGTSTDDAGTTVTIELNGPGLVQTVDATVQDDGTFTGEFDLSDLSAGDEVTATIDGDSQTYTVQEPQIATVDFRQQQSSTGDVVTVAEAYLPEGGFVVIHDANGDVIGSSDYIAPGTVEDVDVLLDTTLSAGDNQVTAMAHQDDNDNQTLDFPGADAPYTNADGDAVTDSATVRVPDSAVSTPTDTPTTTTTTTTTDEPADTTTDEGDGDGPGFGIAVALVALLGAALLAVRRNN